MAARPGRRVTVLRNGEPIAQGIRTKTVTVNNEPIDITSDDDAGFRALLETDVSVSSIDLSIEGVTKDVDLMQAAVGRSTLVFDIVISSGTGEDDFGGRFFLASYELGASHDDAATFSASFQSTGPYSNEST